jgi:hypothetical protein
MPVSAPEEDPDIDIFRFAERRRTPSRSSTEELLNEIASELIHVSLRIQNPEWSSSFAVRR